MISWQLLLETIGLLPIFVLLGFVLWKRHRLDQIDRRDPITTELRNLPGQSLQSQSDDLYDSRLDHFVLALSAGLMVALIISIRRLAMEVRPWDWLDTLLLLSAIALAIYLGRKVAQEMPRQRQIKHAIRAEQATAQELAASLAGSNRVIHDLQAGEFNIDHVAITPAGVFAVETKSRLKPPAGNGSPKVKYDGKSLDFGSWKETKPVDQADRQARWLANYLRESTGEAFPVTAVLALPGWYVERTAPIKPNMVQVINPKNSGWLLLPENKPPRLDPKAIQRAAFALEKLAQSKTD